MTRPDCLDKKSALSLIEGTSVSKRIKITWKLFMST